MRSALRSLPLTLTAALLLAVAALPGPVAAEDPAPAPAAAPAAERDYWISLIATPLEVSGHPAIKVEGQTSYPDGVLLDVSVEHRGKPADATLSVRPTAGVFQITYDILKPVLPGYYQVKVAFACWRQDEPLASELGDLPVDEALYPVLLGTVEDARKVSDAALAKYEKEVAGIESIYGEMRKFYQQVILHHDLQKSPEEWNGRFGSMPEDIQREVMRLSGEGQETFLPAYPLLHDWALEGWGTLQTAFATLSEGVVVEITEMMSRKKIDRQFFLKKGDELVYGYAKGMRAQILMERSGELRERMVYQTSRLLWMYQQSSKVYRIARGLKNDVAKEEWKALTAEFRKQLGDLEKEVKAAETSPLARQFPQLVGLILRSPDALRSLWSLYDKVILEGQDPGQLTQAISEAENACYLCVVPAIEVLGMKREAINRMMQRGFAGGTSPEDKDKKDVPLSDDPAQAMGDYVQSKIDAMGGGMPGERLRAMRVILQMGPAAKAPLAQVVNTAGHSPEVLAMCHICLARLGEAASEPAVLAALGTSADDNIRALAASTIGILGRRRHHGALETALEKDASASVRVAAARALPDLKTARGIPALIKALSDPEAAVRTAALAALETIAGRKMNFDPDLTAEQRKAPLEAIEEWWKSSGAALITKEGPEDAEPEPKAPAAAPAAGTGPGALPGPKDGGR